ncbi:hypothetical protein ABH935_000565 [Catenulispora sp. GAS73]|uniref:ankyrin repeat domain-containing protein n=1 Tax=Catenulispora sp. GAS73 TaxID=3156269 RepID=UPI0035162F10
MGTGIVTLRRMRPTALLRASEDGDTELVRKLLQEHADIDVGMRHRGSGRTPLLEAIVGGHPDTAAVLVAAHADVEARDTAVGYTALAWAAYNDLGSVVRLLVEHGAELNSRSGAYEETPLMVAARQGHAETVRVLLELGAQADLVDSLGMTALSTRRLGNSGEIESEEVRALLIEAGAAVAAAIPEPLVLPWPSVVPGEPGYADPVAVVRGFIVELGQWEREALAEDTAETGAVPRALAQLFQERDELAAVYLTERVRTYRSHSIGTPLSFDERETLHGVEYPKPAKCELLVRDPVDHPLRSERIYTAVKKRGEWRLDSMKSRPLGTATWGRRLL